MGNEFFYTFSTIPQVLAAVIALVGVFAIFQIQHINRVLDGLAQNFFDILREEEKSFESGDQKAFIGGDSISELRRFKLTYKYKNIVGNMDHVLSILKNSRPDFHKTGQEIRDEFSTTIDNKHCLIRSTISSTGYSCILIQIAIFILPFSNKIEGFLSWLIILAFFLLTCFSMYKIYSIINKALRD